MNSFSFRYNQNSFILIWKPRLIDNLCVPLNVANEWGLLSQCNCHIQGWFGICAHSYFDLTNLSLLFVSPEVSLVRDCVITHSVRSMYVCVCMYVVICKIDHCIHIHWCIPTGLGHNDPWVESHMWPQQTWGQRSSRGQWPLVQVFGKKDQCIHILWCIFKSNITMIA